MPLNKLPTYLRAHSRSYKIHIYISIALCRQKGKEKFMVKEKSTYTDEELQNRAEEFMRKFIKNQIKEIHDANKLKILYLFACELNKNTKIV